MIPLDIDNFLDLDTVYNKSFGWVNGFTEELDKHLLYHSTLLPMKSYLYYMADDRYFIRFPGSTVGLMLLNSEKVITSIKLNPSSYDRTLGCYSPTVLDVPNKYLGKKLVFKE